MAKRKEKPAEEGSPAWMTTFSDLMNLLLCFFVLLFASSTMDEGKIQRIAASFDNMSFSILQAGSISLVDGEIVSGGVTQLPGIESILEYIGVSSEVEGNNEDLSATGADDGTDDASDKPDSAEKNEEIIESKDDSENAALSSKELKKKIEEQGMEQSEKMYDEISEIAESYNIDDEIILDYNSQYVSIDLKGALLFEGGRAEIREDAKMFMQKIAAILDRYRNCVIEFEGHTDSVPIHNSRYASNRELSTARAISVYEYIMDEAKLKDENMKVVGYGESRPVASNDTEEGRAKNRRVTIKIYNRLNSETQ